MAAQAVRELTREEIVDLIDKHARTRRGISGEDLLRSWRDGNLDAPGEVADLLALAELLPEDDPLLAA